MTIRRAAVPADNFTIISNDWVRDENLSWKSRGILTWLASHAVGFKVSETSIINAAPDGRDAVRAAVRQLEERGYLIRARGRAGHGTFGTVEYILCDPSTAENPLVGTNDGKSVNGGAADPAPSTENPSEVATRGNKAKPQAAPTTENPAAVASRANDASPQVGTNDGKSVGIRRTNNQKTKKTKKEINPALDLAVGAVADRNERGAVTTPSATSQDFSRLAGDVLGKLPAHYREAPAWLRSRMLTRIEEALHAGNAPAAVIAYAAKFAADPNFGAYEHLRQFADAVRKLTVDVSEGITCPGCGLDSRHPFCTVNVAGGF